MATTKKPVKKKKIHPLGTKGVYHNTGTLQDNQKRKKEFAKSLLKGEQVENTLGKRAFGQALLRSFEGKECELAPKNRITAGFVLSQHKKEIESCMDNLAKTASLAIQDGLGVTFSFTEGRIQAMFTVNLS